MNRRFVAVGERDPRWHEFERAYLAARPFCEACMPGAVNGGLQLHHIVAWQHFHGIGRPDLEFDERNLIVLCQTVHKTQPSRYSHHLMLGHLGAFTRCNLDVRSDAALFRGMKSAELRADPRWLAKKMAQVKTYTRMNRAERAELRQVVDARFPLLDDPPDIGRMIDKYRAAAGGLFHGR